MCFNHATLLNSPYSCAALIAISLTVTGCATTPERQDDATPPAPFTDAAPPAAAKRLPTSVAKPGENYAGQWIAGVLPITVPPNAPTCHQWGAQLFQRLTNELAAANTFAFVMPLESRARPNEADVLLDLQLMTATTTPYLQLNAINKATQRVELQRRYPLQRANDPCTATDTHSLLAFSQAIKGDLRRKFNRPLAY
ncbi:hypothetical protein HUU62_05195 [Rhodoferax sp. 4810]|nr:hypothetical protein [Rhodoferax jenense]